MGSTYQPFKGTTNTTFHVGGPGGPAIKQNGAGIQARNAADSALTTVEVALPTADGHAANLKTLKFTGCVLIEFSFDGASAPAAGANSGKFGFCHTSGGAYSAGDIVYDNGTALETVTVMKGMKVTSTSSVSGTVSLNANGLYVAQAAAAPYSWTIKGDGSGTLTGTEKTIGLILGTNAQYDSTTSIPSGSVINKVMLTVTTPYSSGSTIQIAVNGSTPLEVMSTTENFPEYAEQFVSYPMLDVGADNAGLVRIAISGAPAAGAGKVYVSYYETTYA